MSRRVRARRALPRKWKERSERAKTPEGIAARKQWERNRLLTSETFKKWLAQPYRGVSLTLDLDEPNEGASAWYPWRHRSRGVIEARTFLALVAHLLPRRVAIEEIGDAEELSQRLLSDPTARFVRARVYWLVFKATAVALWTTFRYLVERYFG